MPPEVVLVIFVSIAAFIFFVRMVFEYEKQKNAPKGLVEEVAALKDRVKVLERISVEEGHSLAREIAALEDRSGPELNHLSTSASRHKTGA